jgi:hypothetical protein
MAQAQTGTGKTAAFALPLLQKMLAHANTSASPARHPVRALVLAPTRELVIQVHESVVTYNKNLPLRSTVVFGGVDMKPQEAALNCAGVEILVATPGRLLDHCGSRGALLSQVQFLVLDEADRMLDMGFMPDLKRILDLLPKPAPDPAVLRHLRRQHRRPGQELPAESAEGGSGPPQQRHRTGGAGGAQGQGRRQAGCPGQGGQGPGYHPGPGLHPHQDRRRQAGPPPAQARHPGRHHPRRQGPAGAPGRPGRLQAGQGATAGGHRHRRPGPGHRRTALRGELRIALCPRGLRAPHRPHRPRRRFRPGGLPGVPRGGAPARRHRALHQARPEGHAPAGGGPGSRSSFLPPPWLPRPPAPAPLPASADAAPNRSAPC